MKKLTSTRIAILFLLSISLLSFKYTEIFENKIPDQKANATEEGVKPYGQDKSITKKINEALYLIRITDNVWMHVSFLDNYPCNGMVLIESNEAFLFDTPSHDSVTVDLINYLKNEMNLEITGLVTADWHIDSQGGLAVINELNIPGYSHEMTRKIAKSKELPITSNGFSDSLTLHFEGQTIELYYPGAAHTMDNIVAWLPEQKILFAACMVKIVSQNNLGFTGDGDENAYPETLQKVIDKYHMAEYVISGHGNYGGFEMVTHTKKIADKK